MRRVVVDYEVVRIVRFGEGGWRVLGWFGERWKRDVALVEHVESARSAPVSLWQAAAKWTKTKTVNYERERERCKCIANGSIKWQ